jgi:tRNA threonylcarbamoyladenosine biosynthesis protein TsaB
LALILNIDCATNYASVCLANNETVVAFLDNRQQKEHASFLQVAIKELLSQAKLSVKEIEAVAVTSGPGSYTGLRVGMASAKGLCYALNIPLITVSTLEVMARGAIESFSLTTSTSQNILFCPLLDARRMEVFTAVYDRQLVQKLSPVPLIIEGNPFAGLLIDDKIVFFGSGSEKCKSALASNNSIFVESGHSAKNLATLSSNAFRDGKFADLAYAEPQYLKNFHSTQVINSS